jgi:hypothetical protein
MMHVISSFLLASGQSSEAAGVVSRYSDSLRAGRSSDRNSVGARFSASVQTGPETHTTSGEMGTRSSRGYSGRGVVAPPRMRMGRSYTSASPLYLHRNVGGDLYLYLYLTMFIF